jgi:hypothetical protein
MQFAKDTFFLTLRDRLAAVNPARTVQVDGINRPAVIVAENEPATELYDGAVPGVVQLPACFHLLWGAAKPVAASTAARRPMMQIDCTIAYCAAGSGDIANDRGRTLAVLDTELLQIASPQSAAKQDATRTPALDLGTNVLWTRPSFADVKAIGAVLYRETSVTVLFFPEVDF